MHLILCHCLQESNYQNTHGDYALQKLYAIFVYILCVLVGKVSMTLLPAVLGFPVPAHPQAPVHELESQSLSLHCFS